MRRRPIVRATLALVTLSAPAFAQRAVEEEELGDVRAMLQQRGRDVLHPGEPLTLVGLGQGAPEFLASTPALGALTLGGVEVARDGLRARKLGLYEGGRSYATGPRRAAPLRADGPRPKGQGLVHDTTSPAADERAALWPWLLAGAITAASLTVKIRTKRRARA